ncbi:MAG TPA: L-dopachrome tautomerase-related protein [Chitinophagaceae bacterium]|nr:L-dopachrome tautomerase-related protein [Chitinophagaceae bacterium]
MKRSYLMLSLLVFLFSCKKDNNNNTNGRELELVFEDNTYQLTGVAVADNNRLFTNYPLWSDIHLHDVVEVNGLNASTPYPDMNWNSWEPGQNGENKWVCVQAVYRDDENFLWVVDPAAPKMGPVYQDAYKLVKINLSNNSIERSYPFDGIAGPNSYINDVRIDNERNVAYLTNSNEGGIIVLDLNTGQGRQVLQDHYSVKSDPAYTFIIDGKELRKNGQPVKIHSDGIALTPDREWLYYKPLTDDKLYRIRTEHLRNASLSNAQLGALVEDLGHFTASDGMIFDSKGNLYLSDMQNYQIVMVKPDLRSQTFIQDDRLIWPDSFSIMGDYLYVSCSQINKQPEYNEGVNKRTTPYTIYRVKLP